MSTVIFRGLKAQGYSIRYFMTPRTAALLQNHAEIDEAVMVNTPYYAEMDAQIAGLPCAQKDVDLRLPFHSDVLGRFDHPLQVHVTAHYCRLAGVPVNDDIYLPLAEAQLAWGRQFAGTVFLHPQTNSSPYKHWPYDRWRALADRIRTQWPGLTVLQLGEDHEPAIDGVPRLQSPSVLHAMAALKHARLLIGLDSVFNHAAKALGTPAIILWGSTHPQGYGYEEHINLVNGVRWTPEMGSFGPALRCQPCYRVWPELTPGNFSPCPNTLPYPEPALPQKIHPTPLLQACMNGNTVDTVFYYVSQMLQAGS